MRYDLIVIGSDPAGTKGAIAAAKLGKRVALVEQPSTMLGIADSHTGTTPSRAIRDAIMLLTGFRHRVIAPESYERRCKVSADELQRLAKQFVTNEAAAVRDQLQSNGIELFAGKAQFTGPHNVEVQPDVEASGTGSSTKITRLTGDRILIAVGTRPSRPAQIPFDGEVIFDSEEVLRLQRIPRSMVVIGGDAIGLELAMMFAVLGCEVTVADNHDRLLPFCDREIVDLFLEQGHSLGLNVLLKHRMGSIARISDESAVVTFENGRKLSAESVLIAGGRRGNTDSLNLEAAGLEADEQGCLWCNEFQQSWAKHIYGAGDVVGFPSLASIAMDQGRRAICHAFDQPVVATNLMSYGLGTTPEVAMIGPTEEQLCKRGTRYQVGTARFQESARGHLSGDLDGMLKLLFDPQSHKLLAAHCLGESACELIRIGQTVMSLAGTIESLCDTVFNEPAIAECYKVAALNGLSRADCVEHSDAEKFAQIMARSGFETSDVLEHREDDDEPLGTPACARGSSLVLAR